MSNRHGRGDEEGCLTRAPNPRWRKSFYESSEEEAWRQSSKTVVLAGFRCGRRTRNSQSPVSTERVRRLSPHGDSYRTSFQSSLEQLKNVLWKDQFTGVLAGCFVRVPKRIRKRSKPSPGRMFLQRGCETVDACAGYRSIVALLYGLEIPQLTVVILQTGFVALQWGTSKYLVVAICKLRFRPTVIWNYIGRNGKVCGATRSWSWCLLRQRCKCGDKGSTKCPSCVYR